MFLIFVILHRISFTWKHLQWIWLQPHLQEFYTQLQRERKSKNNWVSFCFRALWWWINRWCVQWFRCSDVSLLSSQMTGCRNNQTERSFVGWIKNADVIFLHRELTTNYTPWKVLSVLTVPVGWTLWNNPPSNEKEADMNTKSDDQVNPPEIFWLTNRRMEAAACVWT